jgi:Fic family protein
MVKLDFRPSLHLVTQVGLIDRFAGSCDRVAPNKKIPSESWEEDALIAGSRAIRLLDTTLTDASVRTDEDDFELLKIVGAHLVPFDFTIRSVEQIFCKLNNIALTEQFHLRTTPTAFRSRAFSENHDIIFPTVSPFLIQQRLEELLSWTKEELEQGSIHPLLVISTFHLLFLQIHPFPTHNHCISIILLWQLLANNGYDFVKYHHLAVVFEENSAQYFTALKQAEKTANHTWATVNIWFEFFLDSLIESTTAIQNELEQNVQAAKLTDVQSRIVETIGLSGACTREKISTETGVPISTVKYNLSVLTNRGLLRREGGGRTTSYRLS